MRGETDVHRRGRDRNGFSHHLYYTACKIRMLLLLDGFVKCVFVLAFRTNAAHIPLSYDYTGVCDHFHF